MATAETESTAALAAVNERLARMTAEERVAWAVAEYPGTLVVSTSFGAQAAVMLSLATRAWPDIPVILVDTGYLFPETYRFADELQRRLRLNLQVFRPEISPAWLEARHGRLWEQGAEGLAAYNRMMKVEPMQRALRALGAKAWLAGLRRTQAATRRDLPFVGRQDGRTKILPVLDWTDRDVYRHLEAHGLPYHPLWEKGYVSIGDMHTSQPLSGEMTAEQTRFFGLKRECGLHESMDGSNI
ncbi:MAG TPA: phosphoadenylyl-sulfate reductase [Opitutaceae bacterium]|jgi:phosphoadenosine phosphosulfate reductase|nr:phosphoadenylyl-sulfate reductase [Opitutaceae bacterium]